MYADRRIMVANKKRMIREIIQIKNRFTRWVHHIFSEYKDVFGDYEAQRSILLLKSACTPKAIIELRAKKINQIWRDAKLRAVGMKRATPLCETAKRRIGLKIGYLAAEYEMKLLWTIKLGKSIYMLAIKFLVLWRIFKSFTEFISCSLSHYGCQ